jgi:hypothetical protein
MNKSIVAIIMYENSLGLGIKAGAHSRELINHRPY